MLRQIFPPMASHPPVGLDPVRTPMENGADRSECTRTLIISVGFSSPPIFPLN